MVASLMRPNSLEFNVCAPKLAHIPEAEQFPAEIHATGNRLF